MLLGTTAPFWKVSVHSTLTWACQSASASLRCPVSCSLFMRAVAYCVLFLLTDHYHQTLLTRPMKGVKAREEFAIAFLSDKYRWSLLLSLLWGWFTTSLNSSPVSSTPLHFKSVVCLRQFIIHSSFPLFFYVRKDMISPPWEVLARPVCWSVPGNGFCSWCASLCFSPLSSPYYISTSKSLDQFINNRWSPPCLNIKWQCSRVNTLSRKGVYGLIRLYDNAYSLNWFFTTSYQIKGLLRWPKYKEKCVGQTNKKYFCPAFTLILKYFSCFIIIESSLLLHSRHGSKVML